MYSWSFSSVTSLQSLTLHSWIDTLGSNKFFNMISPLNSSYGHNHFDSLKQGKTWNSPLLDMKIFFENVRLVEVTACVEKGRHLIPSSQQSHKELPKFVPNLLSNACNYAFWGFNVTSVFKICKIRNVVKPK